MKLTIEPASGGPTDDLAELGAMIRRAVAALSADGADRDDLAPGSGPLRFRCRVTVGGKVRALEVTR